MFKNMIFSLTIGLASVLSASFGLAASAPMPPTALKAVSVTKTGATITWQASPSSNITRYVIYINGKHLARVSGNVFTYTVSNLNSSSTYTLTVRARNSSGIFSEASNALTLNLGTSSTVSTTPVNGACGTANGVKVSSAPVANLCSTGTSSSVSGSGPWSWSCAGSNGGTTAACTAPILTETISAGFGVGGILIPYGNVVVNYGASQKFTVKASVGYTVGAVTVDGKAVTLINNTYTMSDVTSSHTIKANFNPAKETITVTAASYGSITPSGSVSVNYGASQKFTLTPNPGYSASLKVDGTAVTLTNNTYTLIDITKAHTVAASFSSNTETITATAASNGTISPSGLVSVNYGSSQTFTLTPATGYTASLTVDGTSVTLTGNAYTLNNITTSHTVAASFVLKTETLTVSAASNGTISPSGSVSVNYGASQTFTLTPATGYTASLIVDGTSVTLTGNAYTLNNITTSHTVAASFVLKTETLTVSAASNGTISPSGLVSVNYGSSQTFTLTPATGYTAQLSVDGTLVPLTANSYTLSNITTTHTIAASFVLQTETLTVSAASNGTISPSGSVSVNYGASQTFTLTPATGYSASLTVDGIPAILSGNSFTLSNITANHTVIASFTLKTETLTISAGSNGTVTPSGTVAVNYGTSQTFTVTPSVGYTALLSVDGTPVVLSGNTYTLTNITSNHTVAAVFSLETVPLTVSAGTGGSISPSGSVTVSYGASQTFTLTPGTGYTASLTVDGSAVTLSGNAYTLTDITAVHTVIASFTLQTETLTVSAASNGTISPSGSVVVNYGSSQTFTLTPASGYSASLTIDGSVVTLTNNSYTLNDVTTSHTVAASFTFTIVPVNGVCGSANGTTVSSAPSTNLCSSGVATTVSGSGPWTWSCNGSNGGSNASCSAPVSSSSGTIQSPGPSAALFANPYYSCVTNYYVSPTGSDSNNGTSAGTPWLTLQHANNALPSGGAAAGSCINVAPGTYNGVTLNKGGNLASSTGYVTYRCTAMDSCTVNGTAGVNGNGGFYASGTGSANYVIIDGFTVVGNGSTYGVGISFTGTTNGVVGTFGSHHDWVFNSIVRGFGQGGIGFAEGDYSYAFHNEIYDNAYAPNCDSGAQGSGLGDNSALDIGYAYPSYAPTADDKVNPNPLIGSFVTGSSWFHKAYNWNVIYNNYLTPCGTGDTDGNNIILDSFGTGNGNVVAYPDQTLIAFNVVYNAAGGGIHVFFSEFATIANNTSYNNSLDPADTGSDRPAIDTNQSYGDTVINNIAIAIPAAHTTCAYGTAPYAMFNNAIVGSPPSTSYPADTFSHNITMLMGGYNSCQGSFGVDVPTGEVGMYNGDTYSLTANKVATNPDWVNVGTTSTGTESTAPVGTNFALAAGSPAIGYGLTESYLPAQSVDAGACSSALSVCPPPLSTTTAVNGTCGSANGTAVSSSPSSNLCSSGSATAVNGSGPWTWVCDGTNGGTNASCSAPVQGIKETITVSSGSGGTITPSGSVSINYGSSQTFTLTPAGGYSASLTVDGSAVTLTNNAYTLSNVTTPHTVAASFTLIVTPVNGTCGSANGTAVGNAPTTNLCSSGSATAIGGTGPWAWSCDGSGGGSTASCSAPTTVLNVTLNSLSASVADVQPGQIITFSITMTPNQSVSNYPFAFWVHPVGSSTNTAQGGSNVTFTANTPLTQTYSWTVPAGTASGAYYVQAFGYNPSATAVYVNATVSFTIGSSLVNGTCGTAGGSSFTSTPIANLCSTGTAAGVTGSGPFSWSCDGANGGTTASCSALLAVNGTCGSSNGATFSSSPTTNLCATGTATMVGGAGPWYWVCLGINQGSQAACSAAATFTNGACGAANEIANSNAPASGLCSVGTASTVTGTGPWTWSCASTNGGTSATCMAPQAVAGQSTTEQPGPSAALLANPVYGNGIGLLYSCVNNYYVSPTGSDSNPGTLASPWLTIQHADSSARKGGDCINVAPGTYSWSGTFIQTHGGSSASPTGYVTYRCESLDACHILNTSTSTNQIWMIQGASYVIIDGFEIDGNEQLIYGGGAATCISTAQMNPWWIAGHHLWFLNNKTHGCNLGGIGIESTEWIFSIHNESYDNAWTSGYQGSGLGYVVMQPLGSSTYGETYNPNTFPPYTPTAQDNGFAPFHNLVLWNKVHDNGCTTCTGSTLALTTTANTNSNTSLTDLAGTTGLAVKELVVGPGIQPLTYVQSISGTTVTLTRSATTTASGGTYTFQTLSTGHTDGNGIIMDTWDGGVGGSVNTYPFQTLVAYNDSENNGGRGIEIFATNNVTIANNSTYNNGLDVTNPSGSWTELSESGGQNNNWYNNTAFAAQSGNYALEAGDGRGNTSLNNKYQDNVVYGGLGVGLWNNDISYWTTTGNKNLVANPLYVNPSGSDPGNLTLQSTSPAIGYAYAQSYLPAWTTNAGAYQQGGSITTAVNGTCGSANGVSVSGAPASNLCSTGTATSVSGSGPFSWNCDGSNGGTNASCSAPLLTATPVNGVCGSANGVEIASAPAANLCSTGSASSVTETSSTLWNWNCSGNNGGTSAACSAPVQPVAVNGNCGSANGTGVNNAPSSNLCSSGVATTVSGSGPWSWTCDGTSGGTNSGTCTAPVLVNGSCGSANGISVSSAPTSNLCATGTATTVSGSGPWAWSCTGSNGGSSASCSALTTAASTVQDPGPSPALFANPYYTCLRNFYVATNGKDSNPGTQAQPWLTLKNADSAVGGRVAGDCVNVEPGTYASGFDALHGGNLASSTGYVVYRCATMDGCTITDPGGIQVGQSVAAGSTTPAAYVMFDGFNMAASSATTFGQGFQVYDGNKAGVIAAHHVWVLNSIISGFGQSGVQFNDGEYFYVIHNKVFNNSTVGCGAQGSGISYCADKPLTGYTPTIDDMNNPNPLIGSLVTGSDFFHNVVEWNVVYNNALTQCGTASSTYDTDGNNIIMDTFSTANGNTVTYTNQTLIAFNVVYNSGGGGIHVFYSEDVTVANNTCYNSYLDPYNSGSSRACIDTPNSYSNTIINNLAVAIPAAHTSCAYNTVPYAMWNDAIDGAPPSGSPKDTFSNNITQLQGGYTSCQDVVGTSSTGEIGMWQSDVGQYSAASNKENTNPGWVNVGTTSVGTESTQPVGTNFALAAGSPAIGYGLKKSYLPAQSVDAGACSSTLSSCP